MAEVMHRAIEAGPMLLLLRRELQFIFDPLDVRIAVRDDLFGRELRLALLGQHRLLGSLPAFGRFGRFRRTGLFRPARCGRLPVFPDTKHAGKYTDYPADRAPQHATDRSGRLVAPLGSLLDALNQPLRIYRLRRAEKHDDDCPKRETQFQLRARCRRRTDHYLVSIIDFDMLAECFWRAAHILPSADIIVFAPSKSTCRAAPSR